LRNELRLIQTAADQLHANRLLESAQAKNGDMVLRDCVDMVVSTLLTDSKRTDWSGSARIVADGGLAQNQVAVPVVIFETLLLQHDEPVLLTAVESTDGSFTALLP
jgi:adenosyl cobinamide kinase/adenosyl cobinamide phosphate guanylyltransferase